MWQTLVVALLVLVVATLSSTSTESAAADATWRVIPGVSVGPLRLTMQDSEVTGILGSPGAVCVQNMFGSDEKSTDTILYYPRRGLQVVINRSDGETPKVESIRILTNIEITLRDIRPNKDGAFRQCNPNGDIPMDAPKNFYFTDRGVGLGANLNLLIARHGAPKTSFEVYWGKDVRAYVYDGIIFYFWKGELLEMFVVKAR